MSQMNDPTAGGTAGFPAPDPLGGAVSEYEATRPLITAPDVGGATQSDASSSKAEVAKETAAVAKEGAKNVASDAKQHAGALASEAAGHARGVLDQALGQAREQGDQQAARAAGGLRSFSDQARALSEGRTEEAGRLGDVVTRVGDQAQQWAGRLESGGLQGMADDVSRFARRRPGLFLAAAAGLGFVAGRALRANQAAQSDDGSTGTRYSAQYEPAYASDPSYSRYPDDLTPTTPSFPAPDAGTLAGGSPYETGVR